MIGGIVVGALSGSQLGVSGPAAGLVATILAGVAALGGFPTFCLATMIAGGIQIALGLMGAGTLARYFPTSVIKGMLAAIGIIIILKQIPHLVGYDADYEGDFNFRQPDGNIYSLNEGNYRKFEPGLKEYLRHIKGKYDPTVRPYSWKPFCDVVGHFCLDDQSCNVRGGLFLLWKGQAPVQIQQ